MKRLIWSGPARRDLFDIAAYYGRLDADLPSLLLERVEEAPLVLLDTPQLGSPTARPGVRKWRVARTPFLLFYTVRGETVSIRRVRHASTDWESEA